MRSDPGRRVRDGARTLLLLLGTLGAAHAAPPVPEADLKAAFVFNFAIFTQWPAQALASGAPLSLCAGGAGPLYAALGQLNDKVVNGHRIALRAAAADARGCHVLVLDRADRARWPQWRRDLGGAAVLTVADDADPGADGAVIVLELEDNRIGFTIDLGAARDAHLTLSSKLLRLARSVQ